jgi:hypothetical protein
MLRQIWRPHTACQFLSGLPSTLCLGRQSSCLGLPTVLSGLPATVLPTAGLPTIE